VKPIPVELEEWEHCSPTVANSPLAGIFLHDRTERELADHLSRAGMVEILELRQGLSLQASSYVGRISLGDVELTIRPKLRGMPFLQLLRYAYGLRDLQNMTQTSYSSEELTFQDMLIQQLIAEIEELVARGLHRKYVQTESELASPRGRINVARSQNRVESFRQHCHVPTIRDLKIVCPTRCCCKDYISQPISPTIPLCA
jgi:5-methylcytosine-specific restriction enzyme subunit McrC